MSWRYYDPQKYPTDKEQVEALHAQMEERIGRKFDLPALDADPVIVSVVRVVNGQITNCVFLEAEVEAQALGETPIRSREMQAMVERFLMPEVRRYHIRLTRSFVPVNMLPGKKDRPGAVPRLLKKLGFTREGEQFAQFFWWLVPSDAQSGKENSHR